MAAALRQERTNHQINLTIQPKFLKEAITCLVETIVRIRSRGKFVWSKKQEFLECPKKVTTRICQTFCLEYTCNASTELRDKLEEEIQRLYWICCINSRASVCNLVLDFYKLNTESKFAPIEIVYETWVIHFHVVSFDKEDASLNQKQEMIRDLQNSIAYIKLYNFPVQRASKKSIKEMTDIFDTSFASDLSIYHFDMDLNIEEYQQV
ncbi:hypothetical protein Ahia01_000462300 [Argonauta hians]